MIQVQSVSLLGQERARHECGCCEQTVQGIDRNVAVASSGFGRFSRPHEALHVTISKWSGRRNNGSRKNPLSLNEQTRAARIQLEGNSRCGTQLDLGGRLPVRFADTLGPVEP